MALPKIKGTGRVSVFGTYYWAIYTRIVRYYTGQIAKIADSPVKYRTPGNHKNGIMKLANINKYLIGLFLYKYMLFINAYQFHFMGSLKVYERGIVILPGRLMDLHIQERIIEGFP